MMTAIRPSRNAELSELLMAFTGRQSVPSSDGGTSCGTNYLRVQQLASLNHSEKNIHWTKQSMLLNTRYAQAVRETWQVLLTCSYIACINTNPWHSSPGKQCLKRPPAYYSLNFVEQSSGKSVNLVKNVKVAWMQHVVLLKNG